MKNKAVLVFLVLSVSLLITVSSYAANNQRNSETDINRKFSERFFEVPDSSNVTEIQQALENAVAREEVKKVEEVKYEKEEVESGKNANKSTLKSLVKKTTTSKTRVQAYSAKRVTSYTSKKTTKLSRAEMIDIKEKQARSILNKFILKYPILKGTQIYVRECPNNWQGCAYYTKGVILIDPDHTASLYTIIAHEVNHIIDYRTDGKIDYNDYHR